MKKILLGIIVLIMLGLCFQFLHGASKTSNKIKVACIGDSITFGMNVEKREENCYPTRLQKLLGERYEVKNFGNSGRGVILSSMRGKEPRAYYKMKSHKDALAFEPDIVICNLGINDIAAYGNEGKAKDFVPDYLKLLEDYQKLPSKPMIFISNKMGILTKNRAELKGDRKGERPIMKMRLDLNEICQKTNVVGIDFFSALQGHDNLLPDGIHPNAEGMRLLTRSIYEQILPYLNTAPHIDMPYYFDKNMVVNEKEMSVVGLTNPNTSVTVNFKNNRATVISDVYGRFSVKVKTGKLGTTGDLRIKAGKHTQTYSNAIVGKLFLALGQSNMEFTVAQSEGKKETLTQLMKSPNSKIRILNRVRTQTTTGGKWKVNDMATAWQYEKMLKGTWVIPTSQNVGALSAISYYFARELQTLEKCPVGVICVAVGGTTTESFISERGLLTNDLLAPMVQHALFYENQFVPDWAKGRARENLNEFYAKPVTETHPVHYFFPTAMYEAGITQLAPLHFDGILFYQGESNAPDQYKKIDEKTALELNKTLLKTLVSDLRLTFLDEQLPFYLVQLPNLDRSWASYRLMQEEVRSETKDAYLCCILDLGNKSDVHPRNKIDVGKRLAHLTQKTHMESPCYHKYQLNGDELMIELAQIKGKLKTKDGGKVSGLEIADKEDQYLFVDGEIMGNFIFIKRPKEIEKIRFVRYAYAPNPKINLVDERDLPVRPFAFKLEEK